MQLLEGLSALGRVAAALERIARALEAGGRSLTGYEEEGASDGSYVGTHDPIQAAKDFAEREAYFNATGISLSPWEEVPRPLNPHKKEWSTDVPADWD